MSLERVKKEEQALIESAGLTPQIGRVSVESALMIYESINELMVKSPEVLRDVIKHRDSLRSIRTSLRRRASEKLIKENEEDTAPGLLNDSDVDQGLAIPEILEDDSEQGSDKQHHTGNNCENMLESILELSEPSESQQKSSQNTPTIPTVEQNSLLDTPGFQEGN